MEKIKAGTLYICATPIGNIEDITLRALNTLKEVDLIAAEDTRHTLKLLNHYNISKPLVSYHQHNTRGREDSLIHKLKEGQSIALVSDAGMPGISDPGEEIIKRAIEEGIAVTVIPGASAAITALVLSGLPTDKFVFEGFLSRDKKERDQRLKELAKEQRTIILYESPHRIKDTLKAVLSTMGNRKIALARELTKKFEEIIRGEVEGLIEKFNSQDPRGEMVVILEGTKEQVKEVCYWETMSIEDHIKYHIAQGKNKKEAVKEVAQERNMSKRDIYQHSLEM